MQGMEPQDIVSGIDQNGMVFEPSNLMLCLIASSLYSNAYIDTLNQSCYSLDMVRLKFDLNPNAADKLLSILDTWALPDVFYNYVSNKIGGYHFLYTYRFKEPDTSIAVGYGLVTGKGTVDEGKGFVEYNPNKLGVQGNNLVRKMIEAGVRFEVARYDIAIDYLIPRNTVRMLKDSRKYSCVMSDGYTEYLGTQNRPGRTKCYDKQKEAGLDMACTRIELTVGGNWSLNKILEKLPTVFSYENASFDGLQRSTKAFAIAVQAHIEKGDNLESWLQLVDVRTRSKIRKAFGESKALEYEPVCVQCIKNQAEKIAAGCWTRNEKATAIGW